MTKYKFGLIHNSNGGVRTVDSYYNTLSEALEVAGHHIALQNVRNIEIYYVDPKENTGSFNYWSDRVVNIDGSCLESHLGGQQSECWTELEDAMQEVSEIMEE